MTDVADDILAHFGKKGMKWGVRNERRREAAKDLVESKKARIEKSKEVRAKTYEAKREAYKTVGEKIKSAPRRPTADAIKDARADVVKKVYDRDTERREQRRAASSGAERRQANKDYRADMKALRKTDEFKRANRNTRGEMVANTALLAFGTLALASTFAQAYG